MEIDSKYKIDNLAFGFEVIDALDFSDEPYLLLERDRIGNHYLSYLIENNFDEEYRVYVQISKRKFSAIISKGISVKEVFGEPENKCVLITKLSLHTGIILESSLIPSTEFSTDFIPVDYYVEYEYEENLENDLALIQQSINSQKIIFDFYLHGQNLIESIKPYAIYKVFTPIVEIIKQLVGFDNRNADKIISFSNLRHSSLGVTIELNISNDLFLEKENRAMDILTDLLNADKKEDFQAIVGQTANTKFISEYKSIIKAVIDNNADLCTAYANPITGEIKKSYIDKDKATKAKEVVEEAFDFIEDTEEVKGIFLEINVHAQEPAFKVLPSDENTPIKGKFEIALLEKLKQDMVNIGKEEYLFTIKTLYYPETVVKSEEIKRYMIDYKKQ